ncbi:MAG: serine/threonine protein kinase [Wujia sp.]
MISSPSSRSMHDTRCLKPGVILKQRYRIEEVIGAGGFGITYKAWDPVLQSYVAIKEYYPSGVATRSATSSQVCVPVESEKKEYHRGLIRFLKEAQDVARFQSEPNIVSIYDYLEENDTAYMIMEYLQGCTLKQYIKQHGGKLDRDFLVHVCLSVADALIVVHQADMIHRDISPENIYVCEDLTIKLIDFGAARQVYFDREQTVSVVLKPGYAPPEQYAKKDKQGPWTDIYALGATLYYAATGEKPEESISRVLEDTVEAPDKRNPELPHFLSQVIMKALSVKIEDRYQSAGELREDILFCADKKGMVSVKARKGYGKRNGRRKRKYFVIAGVCVLVIGIIFVTLTRGTGNRKKQPEQTSLSTATDATMTDATVTDATMTDAEEDAKLSQGHNNSDNPLIMHVPTKEEQEIQDVLTITSAQSEGVSVDKFEYWPDENRGGKGFASKQDVTLMEPLPYEGDCIRMALKYLDTLKKNPPSVFDEFGCMFSVKKRDESGQYKPISKPGGEWGIYDYSTWFTPEYHFSDEWFTLYIPLDDYLEDGQYQIYFKYLTSDTNQTVFQTTVEFTLHRGY